MKEYGILLTHRFIDSDQYEAIVSTQKSLRETCELLFYIDYISYTEIDSTEPIFPNEAAHILVEYFGYKYSKKPTILMDFYHIIENHPTISHSYDIKYLENEYGCKRHIKEKILDLYKSQSRSNHNIDGGFHATRNL